MVPIDISQAAMARVAFLLGQRDLDALKHAVVVSLLAGSAASIAIGTLLVAGSDSLVGLTMWSRSAGGEAVIETGRGSFRFCAITQLLSGLVIVMASVLRGQRDANALLWLIIRGYWGVGLGGAVLFAFAFGFGGTGIWMGIMLAFVFAVALRRRGSLARPHASVAMVNERGAIGYWRGHTATSAAPNTRLLQDQFVP